VQSDVFDGIDRQIAHALQIDARAPFSRIAAVLGVSDQTVARRYTRLRSSGALHIRAMINPYLHGEVPWLVRVRCTPGAALAVADALARREDTAWVRLTSGGTEIVAMVRGHASGSDALLLDRLPRTRRVEQVTAHCLLHIFFGRPDHVIAKHSSLTPAQIAALQPPQPGHTVAPPPLGDTDRQLLAELARDGRTDTIRLGQAAGWSPSTVRRRVAELRQTGAFYFDVDAGPRLFPALTVTTMCWLSVDPAALDDAGAALADHPEIAFAAATTGATNIHASVATPDVAHLYSYLTRHIAQLPGLRQIETAPVLRSVKTTAIPASTTEDRNTRLSAEA
jgi:DNA-binding Lrp family transcriptional regulator